MGPILCRLPDGAALNLENVPPHSERGARSEPSIPSEDRLRPLKASWPSPRSRPSPCPAPLPRRATVGAPAPGRLGRGRNRLRSSLSPLYAGDAIEPSYFACETIFRVPIRANRAVLIFAFDFVPLRFFSRWCNPCEDGKREVRNFATNSIPTGMPKTSIPVPTCISNRTHLANLLDRFSFLGIIIGPKHLTVNLVKRSVIA